MPPISPRRAGEYGIGLSGAVTPDMAMVRARAEAIRRTTPIHPTVAELFPTLMGRLKDGLAPGS